MKHLYLCLLLVSCRIYDPMPLDCRISCGAGGVCPERTTCRDGSCRTEGSIGRCECRAGEERPCGDDVGACLPGVQQCLGTQWGGCEGAVIARPESCNGLDDDCDGRVDEEIALPPPCARTIGVCAAASQQCLQGEWLTCDARTYGRDFEEVEVSCDGLDNDCDGFVDSHGTVRLASDTSGPWFFLTTTRGFALVTTTDAGVELRWLSKELAPIAQQVTTAGAALASSRGDTLILASITDAGVVIAQFDPDGGNSTRTVQRWLDPSALDVSGGFAAASVNGQVELLGLLDGGAPLNLGADTEGHLRLSQTGQTLAWSGGLTRTADLALLRPGAIEPLTSLIDLPLTIAGVPVAQPSQPVFLPDLVAGAPAQTTGFILPALWEIHGTAHLGEVLLIGIEAPNAVWLANEQGTQRRMIPGGLSSARLTAGHEPMAALAWEKGGVVWATQRCTP